MKTEEKNKKNVLVIGSFDVLHPGHIRLLKFAKECGTSLSVAVNSDNNMESKSSIEQQHRLEMVESLDFVDEVFITDEMPETLVARLKPWAVVKGKEFENTENRELNELDKYGGKLIFGSGEFVSDSEFFQDKYRKAGVNFNYSELNAYIQRHNIEKSALESVFETISHLNFAVIGELIVDEYIQGAAVGLSQEDPTIVMTPTKTSRFLGGAAITAGHIKSLGAASVTLLSVIGDDDTGGFAQEKIKDYSLCDILYKDESRPTPLKTRYRVENKTLLRVNQVRKHKISKEIQTGIIASLEKIIESLDALVFSDFNYGLLPQTLIDSVMELCQSHGVKVVADSQTSSQIGDISKYKNTILVTPTEREVRVSLNNSDDGLVILAKKLCEKSSPENLVITLGSGGVFIHIPSADNTAWENDRLAAINTNAIDPAGAGDCFLAASSLCLIAGSSPWLAFYVASIASACQVDTLGNIPLDSKIFLNAVNASFTAGEF